MIYYTLLPEDEIKTLRKEYHIRLFITIVFFISSFLTIGIFSLIPSYVYTNGIEGKIAQKASDIEKDRKASGIDAIERELINDNKKIKKLLADSANTASYLELIQSIISSRKSGITMESFSISKGEGTSTPIVIVFQGKSPTREALINFKDGLQLERNFSKVELPISDLVKNKDLTFSIRLETRKLEDMTKK